MEETLKIGFALTGSFCTFSRVMAELERLVNSGIDVLPIMSETAYKTDTRFGKAAEFVAQAEELCGKKVLKSIPEVEPIGPKNLIDALVIAPCTGNTISKIAAGMTDTCVAMAAKSTLRNQKPVVIAVSTNDGLTASAKNIGLLLNTKNIFFVPYCQDDPKNKPGSLVSKMEKILPTLCSAMTGRQIQPILC